MTDIVIADKGNRWEIIPQNDEVAMYLHNETGAVSYRWKHGKFIISKKEADGYSFIEYLNNSVYNISHE